METRIRAVKIPNGFNIADIFYKAIFGQGRKEAHPIAHANNRVRTGKEITIQVPGNPADSCGLGWRKDA